MVRTYFNFFLIVNFIQYVTGGFDNSENNLNTLLFCGLFTLLFIIVYFGRFMSFLMGKRDNKSKKKSLTDIEERTKNNSIETTREILTKIINQNNAK